MYDIHTEGNRVRLRFHGTISCEDLKNACYELEEIEAVSAVTPDRLFDLSLADTALWNFEVLDALAERRRATQLKNPIKSAIYAPTDLQFEYSRMFQRLNDNPKIEVRVFRHPIAAEKWLEP